MKHWHAALVKVVLVCIYLGTLFQSAAQTRPHDSLLLYESFTFTDTVVTNRSTWDVPSVNSMMAGHNNYRSIGSETYDVFLNATLDSVIIVNWTREEATGFPIPRFQRGVIDRLYFHKPDSIFLFLDREFIHLSRKNGKVLPDFVLCNGNGEIVNEYSLDDVPYIYNGQINPMVMLSPDHIFYSQIQSDRLYMAFNIYLPSLGDSIHLTQKMSMLCEYNLTEKSVNMLNIFLPDELIGKRFKSESDGMMLDFFILNDSTLLYSFYNYGAVFLYHLKQRVSEEVFPANQFPFRSNEVDDPDPTTDVNYGNIRSEKTTGVILRWVTIREYKHYQPFRILQVFDRQFNLTGCLIYDGARFTWLNDQKYGTLFFDKQGLFSVSLKDVSGLYLHVQPDPPVWRSVEYIEQNLLSEKTEPTIDEAFEHLSYHERILLYLDELGITDSTKVIVIDYHAACPHVFNYLLSACRGDSVTYQSERIRYLFQDWDRSMAGKLAGANQIPPEWIIVDDEQIYHKYLHKEEYGNNPLIHYYNRQNGEAFFYDLGDLTTEFRKFLEK